MVTALKLPYLFQVIIIFEVEFYSIALKKEQRSDFNTGHSRSCIHSVPTVIVVGFF